MIKSNKMEGKKMFDYEGAKKNPAKKDMQETVVKVLQVLLGILMAILHA